MTTLLPTAQLTAPLRHVSDTAAIHGRIMDVIGARFDVVGAQSHLSVDEQCANFNLHIAEPVLLTSGVVEGSLTSAYTRSALRHVGERLRIPVGYLDRLVTDEREPVRGLASESINVLAANDSRDALYRYLQTEEGLVLRAVRSDKYLMLDNDAALLAIVEGLEAHSLELSDCKVDADINVDRFRIRITVPEIGIAAQELMADYRSPWDKRPGNELPMLFAGVEISNSETGAGAFQVSPRAEFEVCSNGMTKSVKFRRAHLGSSMSEGTIDWSDQTRSTALQLITHQVTDAVGTYISTDFLQEMVNDALAARGVEIENPARAVEIAQQMFKLNDYETGRVLAMFTKGGDTTAWGVHAAMTAAAQDFEDGERQSEIEVAAATVLERPEAFATA